MQSLDIIEGSDWCFVDIQLHLNREVFKAMQLSDQRYRNTQTLAEGAKIAALNTQISSSCFNNQPVGINTALKYDIFTPQGRIIKTIIRSCY